MAATETAQERYTFAKIPEIMEVPSLIEIQRESYEHFLQRDKLAKTGDAEKEFMLTEFTLVSRQEAASAKVTDISN